MLLVVRDERFVVHDAPPVRLRDLPRQWLGEQVLGVVLICGVLLWPLVLARRRWATEKLVAVPRLREYLNLPAKRLRPLPRWKVVCYRLGGLVLVLMLVRSAFAPSWLAVAAPMGYVLACLFAGKLPFQRQQILGLGGSASSPTAEP